MPDNRVKCGGISLEVRKMTVEDAENGFQTLAEYYFSNSSSCSCLEHFSFHEAEEKIRNMIDHLMNGTAYVYGCFDGKTILGYIWAYEMQFREEHRIYISEVHVDQKHRGKGIGTALLEAVETEAIKRGIPALYIHTESNNSDAIRLYERYGFRIERIQLRKTVDGCENGTR